MEWFDVFIPAVAGYLLRLQAQKNKFSATHFHTRNSKSVPLSQVRKHYELFSVIIAYNDCSAQKWVPKWQKCTHHFVQDAFWWNKWYVCGYHNSYVWLVKYSTGVGKKERKKRHVTFRMKNQYFHQNRQWKAFQYDITIHVISHAYSFLCPFSKKNTTK